MNPNQSDRRAIIQWSFPIQWVFFDRYYLVGLKLFLGWCRCILAGSIDMRRFDDVIDAPPTPTTSLFEMASSVRPLTRSSCAAFRKPSSEFCNEMDVQDLEEVEWAGWRAASKGLIISGESFFIKNGPSPASFSFIFVFSNKHYNFTANKWEKGPSSIWRWDSNLL